MITLTNPVYLDTIAKAIQQTPTEVKLSANRVHLYFDTTVSSYSKDDLILILGRDK